MQRRDQIEKIGCEMVKSVVTLSLRADYDFADDFTILEHTEAVERLVVGLPPTPTSSKTNVLPRFG